MPNPFAIAGPALVSFSGGRTSGYMLGKIVEAHGGKLPDNIRVTFANTGKEFPQTLDFVQRCGDHFGVHIHWLERALDGGFIEVSHNQASRSGEPFNALIRKKQYLPNPVTRFCTTELKIRVMRDFARSLGWDHWSNIVGLRYDEPRRLIEAHKRNHENKERWTTLLPLEDAKVTKPMVRAFWREQPFDLELEDWEGNCDLCFQKGQGKIVRIMRDHPETPHWWTEAEAEGVASKPSGASFRADRPSYATLAEFARNQQEFDFNADDINENGCGSEYCHD